MVGLYAKTLQDVLGDTADFLERTTKYVLLIRSSTTDCSTPFHLKFVHFYHSTHIAFFFPLYPI